MPVATTERVTSSFKLSGLLDSAIHASNDQYDDLDILDRLRVKMMPHHSGDSAIRASNDQYDDPDIQLDRLRVKMMPHHSGDSGWDVFSLEYNAKDPLNTILQSL